MARQYFSIVALLCVGTWFSDATNAQPWISALTLQIGTADSPHGHSFHNKTVPYPQIAISTNTVEIKSSEMSFGGEVYIGRWWDDVDSLDPSPHSNTYSYHSTNMGIRGVINLSRSIIPFALWVGVSRQILRGEFIGGHGYNGYIPPAVRKDSHNSFDFGIRITQPVVRHFQIGVEAQQQLRFEYLRAYRFHPKSFRLHFSISYLFSAT